ncbi:hypothetical protein RM572_20205 [Streptomyces sp. DSM 42041]|uniref:Uncharacterized protein n=1 Tax=Streptomyces hazeniae TaxID=3075538 RepID=A0ABU2NWU8_9ACTN|nr:hypothetical protein [Streptomyces sp. DSM 42041]MDT0381081.1 hypothetical protein [Streptomyces sp. DSM 42041]
MVAEAADVELVEDAVDDLRAGSGLIEALHQQGGRHDGEGTLSRSATPAP